MCLCEWACACGYKYSMFVCLISWRYNPLWF